MKKAIKGVVDVSNSVGKAMAQLYGVRMDWTPEKAKLKKIKKSVSDFHSRRGKK